jgi:glycosyltransferase involved in cell wall biosynthesis
VTRLGIFVGENNWTFFNEIYDDLSRHYSAEVFKPKTYRIPVLQGRLNRWALQNAVQSLLRNTDICFFEWASDLLVAASRLPKKAKIVARLHSFELYRWAPMINWFAVDKIILLSRAMKRNFVELYPEHQHKIEIIHNGRSLSKFQPPKNRKFGFTIGMLGHIAPIKRVYEAVLTLHGLVQSGCPAKLRIAGRPADDYRYFIALQRVVRELNLQNRVFFDGFITDTSSWLQTIDIFISNSYWEGQQVALLEAMASGCYCLSHFWSGADEMLPPENLYVTDADLQKKLIEYAMLPDVEKAASQTMLRDIACEKFDIEQTKTQIRQVIDQLANSSS